MAKFFSEKDIEKFRECFFFNVGSKRNIVNEEELAIIMRSLGYSPTMEEIARYYDKHINAEGHIDFASFLDLMHQHSKLENCHKEILLAFQAQDKDNRGYVNVNEMRNILMNLGEKLQRGEVDAIFRNAGVPLTGQVKYADFVNAMASPAPDY